MKMTRLSSFVLRACIVSVTSGKLRSEKVEMMALCRKQQVRIELLDRHIDQLNKEVRTLLVFNIVVMVCICCECSISEIILFSLEKSRCASNSYSTS